MARIAHRTRSISGWTCTATPSRWPRCCLIGPRRRWSRSPRRGGRAGVPRPLPEPARLRVCYEAGPTGYELARLLHRQGVACQVIAPSLIPRAVGDKVKTDRRDCRRLARLHRAGELVAIRIPTPREEAVRDLCRARADLVDDRSRARRRLQSLLLRHGPVYRAGPAGPASTSAGWAPSASTTPSCRPPSATTGRWWPPATPRSPPSRPTWLAATQPPFADAVRRLAAYRGVGQLGALSVAAEVGDWRRFAHAGAFMAFTGLVPCERSSGDSVWRGHITRTGSKHLRFQLVESAWSYHHRPLIAGALRERQQHVGAETLSRSWAAQLRLCRRFRQLDAASTSRVWPWSPWPGTCRVPVGRDARLSRMQTVVGGSPIGATAPASARTRRSTADAGTIPGISMPRPLRRDATSLGPRLRIADLRSQPANIRVAVRRSTPLRRGPGQPPPGHPPARHTPGTPGAAHRRLPTLTAPFHIRRSNAAPTWSGSSPP